MGTLKFHGYNFFQCFIAVYWVYVGCNLMDFHKTARFVMGMLCAMLFQAMVGPLISWEGEEE